jgi:gamma-glutamyltranspeptidase/glutathione hydrolase
MRRLPTKINISLVLLALIVVGVGGIQTINAQEEPEDSQPLQASGYDRPSGDPQQSRSPIVARHGIVSTSHPLASQAGLDILRRGGNAVDAAIAANAVLGVVEPMSCGIGGDLFVIYWDAESQQLYGLNASGRSPYDLNRDVFQQKELKEIPIDGPLSWSVPGCVRGWEDLSRRLGKMSLGEVLGPAIMHAEEGFPVTQIIGALWEGSAESMKKWPDSAATYYPEGRAPREGEIFKNPNLAASYKAIAREGADAFYQGRLARTIVEYSKANGGYFSMKDFADHESQWVTPVSTNYRGYDLWELPPNGQGIAALQILNLMEPYDIAAMGYGSPEYVHLFVEAKKLAFADRAKYYADPAFGELPVAEMISKPYAARRRQQIDLERAATDVPAGNPQLQHGDTVYLTVVDKDRNCCSLIQSLYYGFGSQVVPGDVGFPIQNRGALFALDDEHLNRLEPHKRPFHTIIPAMVTKEGKPQFCYGVMGGDMQPQGHVQVLINMIDFGMNVQQAGDAARVRHLGSATPTGQPMQEGGGEVAVESGISDETIARLTELGHAVRRSNDGEFGGYQGIWIDWQHGTLHGGSDPRKDGSAMGY